MSATGRGGQRAEHDFYPTPAWPVHRLLERYQLPGGIWIEPGAGEGHIIRAVNQVRSDVQWTAVELRAECRMNLLEAGAETVATGNFMGATLEWLTLRERAAVAFGNPPFRWAMEFIHQARALTGDGNGDSTDHAWMIWPPRRRKSGRLIVLDSTPLAERKAQMQRVTARGAGQERLFS